MTTETRPRGRPATGKTPIRNFRIPDDEYDQIVIAAESRGETVTAYIRRVLARDAQRELRKS